MPEEIRDSAGGCARCQWATAMVEIAREGAEAIDLDRCAGCGRYRLSWWWPKDSSDRAMGSEQTISEPDAARLCGETDWVRRRKLLEEILGWPL